MNPKPMNPKPMNPEPILKVEHLRIEFDTRRGILVAVDDISFQVMPGEVFGIVGESGVVSPHWQER